MTDRPLSFRPFRTPVDNCGFAEDIGEVLNFAGSFDVKSDGCNE